MTLAVIESYESKRGCGYRKPGGLYLVSKGLFAPCGKLPAACEVCPTCSGGIKPSRGWTWFSPAAFFDGVDCALESNQAFGCGGCILSNPPAKAGLLWIGGRFYKDASEFSGEALMRGVSRRIASIPRGFKLGETWCFVAHRELLTNKDGSKSPGIFSAFRPQRIEYVMTEADREALEIDRSWRRRKRIAKLERLVERGVTLVNVHEVDVTEDIIEQELKDD